MRRMTPNEIIKLVARDDNQRMLTMIETADDLKAEEDVAGAAIEFRDPG